MSAQTSPFKLEFCTDQVAEAIARSDRVDQIEFCSDLNQDGLSPSFDDARFLLGHLTIPLKIMIRNRSGNFLFDRNDLEVMIRQARQFQELGVSRFVFGAVRNGRLDFGRIEEFSSAVFPAAVCIHKAIDQSDQILSDLRRLYSIPNVNEILTSGSAASAMEGAAMIRKMIEMTDFLNSPQPQGRQISIIAAGRITHQNLNECHQQISAQIYHGRMIVE